MRGFYEQQWQEAVKGAKIQPSEAVWENIAANLDKDNGRHSWVTILLIAATVTIAFAFPLTIGNSSFEARPDEFQFLSQSELNKVSDDGQGVDNNILENNPGHAVLATVNKDDQERSIKKTPIKKAKINTNTSNTIADSENNSAIIDKRSIALGAVETQGYGMSSFNLGAGFIPTNIDNYYFIPYYLPENKSYNRSLLASLNMGTGSLSTTSGFGSFAVTEGAKFSSDLSSVGGISGNSSYANREEHSGSTYYFGVGISLPIGKRWSVLTGLGYLAQNASGTNNVVLNNGSSQQPLSAHDPIVPGTVFLSESYNYSATNSYINVPVTVKYPFVNRKIKLRGGIGISTDFMISHAVNASGYQKANYKPSALAYKTVVLAGIINMDISYSINNQYAVALETGLRKGITAIDERKDYFPSSFTVGVILFYKIH